MIDTKISTPLFNLPLGAIASGDAPTSLPQRNLLRHLTWSLPSGQAIARAMRIPPLASTQLSELAAVRRRLSSAARRSGTTSSRRPSWRAAARLAGVGARIVGEVFIGLLALDPNSYLSKQRALAADAAKPRREARSGWSIC